MENLIVNNQRVFGHPGGGPGASIDHNIYPGPGWTAAVLGNYKFDIAHSHRKGRDHGPRRPRTGWVRRYPDHVTDPEGSKFCIEPGPVSGR